VVDKTETLYESPEKGGSESGFVAATDGTTSSTITGTNDNHVDLGEGYNELISNGKTPSFDVHPHVNVYDASGKTIISAGVPSPSETDKTSQAKLERPQEGGRPSYNRPSWVLGFDVSVYEQSSVQ